MYVIIELLFSQIYKLAVEASFQQIVICSNLRSCLGCVLYTGNYGVYVVCRSVVNLVCVCVVCCRVVNYGTVCMLCVVES